MEEAVLRHLADEDYSVDPLGADVAMSRTQVHRKLKALTGSRRASTCAPRACSGRWRCCRRVVGTVAEVSYQGLWQPGLVLHDFFAAVWLSVQRGRAAGRTPKSGAGTGHGGSRVGPRPRLRILLQRGAWAHQNSAGRKQFRPAFLRADVSGFDGFF